MRTIIVIMLLTQLAIAQLPYVMTFQRQEARFDSAAPVPNLMWPQEFKGVGDFDGDGTPDYAISYLPIDLSLGGSGSVYVFSGATNNLLHHILSPTGSPGFGISFDGRGDINNDGFADIVIGDSHGPGAAYAYSGFDGTLIHSVAGTINTPNLGLGLGHSVAMLGDINGDGFDDYLAGLPLTAPLFGQAWAISGFDGSIIHMQTGGGVGSGLFGDVVANAGDVNGDGVNDYLVGEPRFSPTNNFSDFERGRSLVFSGATGGLLFARLGVQRQANSGSSVAGIGDVNGDGFDDIAIGEPRRDNNLPTGQTQGRIMVLSGFDASVLYRIHSDRNPGLLGLDVAAVNDVDGDGINDIMAEDRRSNQAAIPTARSLARIYSGANGAILTSFPSQLGGTGNFSLIRSLGDLNGDGLDEIGIINIRQTFYFDQATGTQSIFDPLIRVYESGKFPVESYQSASGNAPQLNLQWLPVLGNPYDWIGDIECSGASALGSGLLFLSLSPADVPVLGYDLLVNTGGANLLESPTISFDALGLLRLTQVSRQSPVLAGVETFLQVIETSPAPRASNGLKFVVIP